MFESIDSLIKEVQSSLQKSIPESLEITKFEAMKSALSNKISSLSDQLKELEVTRLTNIPMETSLESQITSHASTSA